MIGFHYYKLFMIKLSELNWCYLFLLINEICLNIQLTTVMNH